MKRIKVSLARRTDNSYEIIIGRDIIERACLILAKKAFARRMIVIADSNVSARYGEGLVNLLNELSLPAEIVEFPAGEESKTMETALRIAAGLVERRADRTTGLVALGGGVTGDLAGFIASIYMRSVPLVQIPTTLIAQVDSSVGGKTGVDFASGKNLLGAFHQPKMVIVDLAYLDSLTDAEFKNGLAEVVKYGVIDDAELCNDLEHAGAEVAARSPEMMLNIVERCLTIKKKIVEIDEYDVGLRRILNYGHTIGHAVEAASDYRISHGAAVAIGMAAEARISEKKGYLAAGDRERIEGLLDNLGLERRFPAGMDARVVAGKVGVDKKRQGETVPFVLVKRIGVPFINGSVDERIIVETIEEMKK
ncbi:MAG TPA: 3-dehydroquinate synthase [Deltaproteobacteria bacterium]|nr:3-dehydroquinate synthase [Deltaproteobacteria bacterium]